MNIPDFMPRLRRGAGNSPKDGGCLVQVASYLHDGQSWTDKTPCVHPMLRHVAIGVNDTVSESARQGLLKFAPRLIGTGTDNRDVERQMAQWCVNYRTEFATLDREIAYRRYLEDSRFNRRYYAHYVTPMGSVKEEPDHNAAGMVAGFVLREVYQGVMRCVGEEMGQFPLLPDNGFTPWELAHISEAAEEAVIQYLEDMIDKLDEITGRETSGKTVSDEDWARVRDHMAHA